MTEIDKTIAEEAVRIVSGDRPGLYGNPEDNFKNIANFWNAHLETRYGAAAQGIHLDARDVASMMVGMKLAREAWKPTRDNKVDAIGYVLTLDRVERIADGPTAEAEDDTDFHDLQEYVYKKVAEKLTAPHCYSLGPECSGDLGTCGGCVTHCICFGQYLFQRMSLHRKLEPTNHDSCNCPLSLNGSEPSRDR